MAGELLKGLQKERNALLCYGKTNFQIKRVRERNDGAEGL